MSGLKSHIEVAQLTDEKRCEVETKLNAFKTEEPKVIIKKLI